MQRHYLYPMFVQGKGDLKREFELDMHIVGFWPCLFSCVFFPLFTKVIRQGIELLEELHTGIDSQTWVHQKIVVHILPFFHHHFCLISCVSLPLHPPTVLMPSHASISHSSLSCLLTCFHFSSHCLFFLPFDFPIALLSPFVCLLFLPPLYIVHLPVLPKTPFYQDRCWG